MQQRPMLILRNKKLSSGNSNPVPLVNLNKKVVLPSTLYGCEFWNELKLKDYQLLIKFQHFILKDFQGLKTSARLDMCESLVGLKLITSIRINYYLLENCVIFSMTF